MVKKCCLHTCSVMSESCDPADCSPPCSSFPGTSQARILEWVAIIYSRVLSWPKNRTCPLVLPGGSLPLVHLGSRQLKSISWYKCLRIYYILYINLQLKTKSQNYFRITFFFLSNLEFKAVNKQIFWCYDQWDTLNVFCYSSRVWGWLYNGNPLQYSCLENPMGGRAW